MAVTFECDTCRKTFGNYTMLQVPKDWIMCIEVDTAPPQESASEMHYCSEECKKLQRQQFSGYVEYKTWEEAGFPI